QTFLKRVRMLESILEKSKCYVEAAFALQLHADQLSWDVERSVEAMPEIGFPDAQLEFERKEILFLQILDLLERGKAYERAIETCKELEYQDERLTFDYARLGDVLRKRAALYEKIQNEERYDSAYFRVGYIGKKWPDALRNKTFIYKGHEWEKIASFCDRILDRHPDSKLLRQAQPPGDEIREGNTLYVQVTSVKPEQDWSKKVPPFVRSYFEGNEVCVFSVTRPFKKKLRPNPAKTTQQPPNEFLELWTEKTVMVTENRFPGLLRRSEVIYHKTVELSPVENAVIAMINKNREISSLAVKYEAIAAAEEAKSRTESSGMKVTAKQPLNINPFTMSLNGAVDAPVNGGVPMYKTAFLSEEYLTENPDKEEMVALLRKSIDEQVQIIATTLVTHEKLVPPAMRPLHSNIIKRERSS
ncbi:hypothetical protein M427DRAFT_102427, partial [Gonapodya prolifera JEL478]